MDDPDPDIFPDELGGRNFVSKRILPLQIEPKVGNLDKNTRRLLRGALAKTQKREHSFKLGAIIR